MDNNFIPKGMEIINQAINADNADELDKALSLYREGLKYLVTGLKYVKSEKNKEVIRDKIRQYMTRAEQLAEHIQKQASQPQPVATVAGGGATPSSKNGENAKLAASLEGAIVKEKPNVKWDDVAGLEGAKKILKEAVILPVKFPQLFVGKVKPWAGILLYGPPGTGKSYLAKALATEAGSTFLSVSSSDLVSKFQGESERLVRTLFEMARENSPSIIFIDEIDSLCGSRSDGDNDASRRIITEFLVQMQGVGKGNDGVLVLAATNTPWNLDAAIRRRFEKRVYIPLPELQARIAMFRIHTGSTPNSLQESDYVKLGQATDGFQGADISIAVREALYTPIRLCQEATHFKQVPDPQGKLDYMLTPCSPGDPHGIEMSLYDVESERLLPPPVTFRHFMNAVQNTKPAVSKGDLGQQEEWTAQFGLEGS